MGPRELVILLLGLALVAVVLRGLHVAMTARRGQIKLAIDKNIPKDIDLETLESSEFPNGGARVVARSLQQVNRQNQAAAKPRNSASGPLRNSSIPVLMDNVAMSQPQTPVDMLDEAMSDDLYDDSVDLDSFSVDVDRAEQENTAIAADVGIDRVNETEADDFSEEVIETVADEELDLKGSKPLTDVAVELNDLDEFDEDWLEEAVQDTTAPQQVAVAESLAATAVDEVGDLVETTEAAADCLVAAEEKSDSDSVEDPEIDLIETEIEAVDEVEEDVEHEVSPIEQTSPAEKPDVYRYNQQGKDKSQRREPALTFDDELLDEFSEFSMTAGERIGSAKPLADQVDLFDSEHADEVPATASAESGKKKSFFANLAKKVRPEKEAAAYGASGEYEVFPDDVYEQGDVLEALFDSELESPGNRASIEEEAYSDLVDDFAEDSAGGDHLKQTMEMLEETVSGMEHRGGKNSRINIELAEPEDLETNTVVASEKVTTMAPRPEPKPEPAPTINEPSEVVVLNVMSREGREFHGNDLLQVLITSGLKFGEMNIFHKRMDNSNHGPVLFSVANIINPGIFDLNAMEDFRTRGITLFLTLPSAINNLEALDLMLETAQLIRGALDGELRDDTRNVMTAQTIEHYRQRVRDFELSLLRTGSRH